MKSLLLIGLITVLSQANSPAADKPEVLAMAGEITDKRTTGSFFAECEVELKFTGDLAAEASAISDLRVLQAVDDTGRDLKKAEKSSSGSFNSVGNDKSTLTHKVSLKNPSRNAKVIRSIAGEIDFFNPTAENGGKVVVPESLKKPGAPMESAGLKKSNVSLMYLTKEAYEEKKKQAKEEQKKELGAVGSQFADAFGDAFGGMFGGFGGNEKNSVSLAISDPDSRVVDLDFQEASGKKFPTTSKMTSGKLRQFSFKQPPPPDLQLVVYLATPGALKTATFKVENVPLP